MEQFENLSKSVIGKVSKELIGALHKQVTKKMNGTQIELKPLNQENAVPPIHLVSSLSSHSSSHIPLGSELGLTTADPSVKPQRKS